MIYKNIHCCEQMNSFVEDEKVMIKYNNKFREYGLFTTSSALQLIQYCPWCGNQLPVSLRELWFDELEHLGIEDPISEADLIPSEFLTEDWWFKKYN